MVNTFITRFPVELAVKDLNSQRLGKQRVEANQILSKLLAALAIAKHFNFPSQPKDEIEREVWLKNTFELYKAQPVKLYITSQGDFTTEVTDTVVGAGWSQHTATVMWVGYENALKYYINLCILEWVSRGYTNNMRLYFLTEYPEFPWWVKCTTLQKSHRSALLRKEFVRDEPLWYWNMKHIIDDITPYYNHGYLWISHLTREQRDLLRSGEEHPEFCDPITNDDMLTLIKLWE